MVHASRGRLSRRHRRTCAARSPSWPAWRRRRSAPARPARTGTASWPTTTRIRDHIEAVIPGFERFNERVRRRGGFVLPHPFATRGRSRRRPGKARLTVNPLGGARRPRRSPAAADHPLARPVQHHDLRPRRPLPGDQPGSAGGVRPRRRPGRPRPGRRRHGRRGGGCPTARSARLVAPRASGSSAYPVARGHVRRLLPRGQRARPARTAPPRRSNTPTSKSVIVRLEPTRGSPG